MDKILAKPAASNWRQIWVSFEHSTLIEKISALSFSTIFTLIPAAAWLFALASAIPQLTQSGTLQLQLARIFLPQNLSSVMNSIDSYAQNAQQLSIFAFLISLLSLLSLMFTLRNYLIRWSLNPSPKLSSKERTYHMWALVSSTFSIPLALLLFSGAYFGIFSYLRVLELWGPVLYFLRFFFVIIFLTSVLSFVYWVLCPHAPIKQWLASAFLASLSIRLAQLIFGVFWANSTSYGVLYGAAAVAVGLLLWIFILWACILIPLWYIWFSAISSHPSASQITDDPHNMANAPLASTDASTNDSTPDLRHSLEEHTSPPPSPITCTAPSTLPYNRELVSKSTSPIITHVKGIPMTTPATPNPDTPQTPKFESVEVDITTEQTIFLMHEFAQSALSPASFDQFSQLLAEFMSEGTDPMFATQKALAGACVNHQVEKVLADHIEYLQRTGAAPIAPKV